MRDARDRDAAWPAAEPFLPLKENRFACAAVDRLLARQLTGTLTYIYGTSGSGKTHLVRLFVRETHRQDRSLRVVHCTASEFAADFAQASFDGAIDQFQQRHRELDLFVCEDLSALEGRWETQRQLIVAIDEILAAGGRVLLTCRKLPGELQGVSPKLVNRCHGGVCAPLGAPDVASRVSLVEHFAARRQIPMPRDAAQLLAEHLPVSPRELKAAVAQLEACARLQKSRIDVRLTGRFLKGEVKSQPLTLAQIAQAVARHFEVKVGELRASTRAQGLVLPRQAAMLLAREQTDESLEKIAVYFGRKNHATVLHACRRMQQVLAEDPAARQHLTQIRQTLGAKIPA